ncbi:aminotransferase class I/II-fold pyridoxal phosphate-dependent enzyme [Rossellomorea aquimaris]|uniref:aminotransferase class I/II-fold pyridoxal phosphate-dependent enzyme n=1 Tax=Rossellomorea aquimaris TaxID=189382 RepID=UPI001CD78B65|nr:aminotransferase class I/II-fold pyridoxal phosphate-dependent enzyme [Rossellomorea aquimaris]MCA1061759.1 aminotransferase class I/II-fold pyridoxal phosphate-dependent enzyme [Rossellomorea aquimaris]
MKRDHTRTPLIEAIEGHRSVNPISFHVPGHKNGLMMMGNHSFYQGDLTELSGLDDLHDPHGAIAEAEDMLADVYGSLKSYFLVNGSTVGNIAAILSSCEPGDIVFVQRNCHKSVLNGIKLARAVPVFIETEWDQAGTSLGVRFDSVKKALLAFPHVKACVLTYPTYYGYAYNIRKIMEELHKYDVTCIIDEAHGAHFTLGTPFPETALDCGADIVIQSAHKMLPAMTMGSYLHIGSNRVNGRKVKEYLAMLQSSSPSYPIMASLDYARSYVGTFSEEDLDQTLQEVSRFLQAVEEIHPQLIVEQSHDPLKLILKLEGRTGYVLQEWLESEGIFPELADPSQVLLILPLVKRGLSFPYEEAVKRISRALENVPVVEVSPVIRPKHSVRESHFSTLELALEEMDAKTEVLVSLDEAEGEISAGMVTPYPPGIPLLVPGERISAEVIWRLNEYIVNKANIQGHHRLVDRCVFVYR